MRKTDTLTLAKAMRILAVEIHSDDGVANAAIYEAAERLKELHLENGFLKTENGFLKAEIVKLNRG